MTIVAALSAVASAFMLISPALEAQAPPRRAHHALVYEPATKRVLLSGGSTPLDGGRSFEFFNDLWSFDGEKWEVLPASGSRLSGTSLAFDARRQQVYSFGAYDGTARGLLRVLTAGTWRDVGTHPSLAVAEPGFVYDTRRDCFVSFGGHAGAETWEYANERWVSRDIAGPPARQAHVMVFDEARSRVVLFGGGGINTPGQPPARMGDTWEYDGTRWTQRDVPSPPARMSAGAAFDSKRGITIIFGGMGASGFLGDTWSWDGTRWVKLAESGPSPRAMGYLAYDRARDRIVLFGGRSGWPDGDLNDTWEWDGTRWEQKFAAGSAGASTSGVRSPFAAVGPTFVGISVADIDSSAAWYVAKLGLRVTRQVPRTEQTRSRMTLLEGEGLTIELVQQDGAVAPSSVLPSGRGSLYLHGAFKFGLTVANFDDAVAALRARGVPIAVGPFLKRADQPANLLIRDNAGNYIQIFGR